MSSSNKGGLAGASQPSADTVPAAADVWQSARGSESAHEAPAAAGWEHTRAFAPAPRQPNTPDAWQSTRAQTALATQFLKDEEEYLSVEKADIGRQTGANERELFVSCDPAQAMQQQFEHLRPDFIAIHDIATSSSRKLLLGIAAASGRAVQKLVIRRQGYGTPLATIEFVELATGSDRPLRLYSTEADADTAARHGLARMLLAFSRLGVVMVGELPGHAIAAALKPLQDEMLAGPWPNRNLLLLPLASASTLVTHGIDLGRGTGVTVRTTPHVARPADAWAFITGTWNRLREQGASADHAVPELSGFNPNLGAAVASARRTSATGMPPGDTQAFDDGPMQLAIRPMSELPGSAPAVAANVLERYARQVGDLTGVISCCVFEVASGRSVAHAGTSPSASELGLRGMELLAAIGSGSRSLGLAQALPEVAITLAAHHLLLRPLPKSPDLALHVVLDKTSANLTLARLQVLRMDSLFGELDKP